MKFAVLVIAAALFITACGGGGDGDGVTPQTTLQQGTYRDAFMRSCSDTVAAKGYEIPLALDYCLCAIDVVESRYTSSEIAKLGGYSIITKLIDDGTISDCFKTALKNHPPANGG